MPEKPGLPGIVMMELVVGCTNKLELLRVNKIIQPYKVYWPTLPDNQVALAYLSQFHLSHRLGLQDALIAATAMGQGATLCTFNIKHFSAVPGLITEQPYSRS